MEEIKQLFHSVCAGKLLLINEITKTFGENSAPNELTERIVQVQLSTEQSHLMFDGVSVDQAMGNPQPLTPNEPINTTTTVKQPIVEQFQWNGNLDIESQRIIVDDVNQCLASKNVRILYDDAYSTWICLQWCFSNHRNRIKMFTPVMVNGWSKFPMTREKLVKEIIAWLPNLKKPFQNLEIPPCSKSTEPAIQFVYVLVFAFASALGFSEAIVNPCWDKTIETVRKIIGNALANGLENELSTIQTIWNA